MGGGVSSLPEQFTLAEAKELAGDKWRWQWAERFPRYPGARITEGRGGAVLEQGRARVGRT